MGEEESARGGTVLRAKEYCSMLRVRALGENPRAGEGLDIDIEIANGRLGIHTGTSREQCIGRQNLVVEE
jgi:hypothetical protein